MTLMIGTNELAERLYVAWRERMEIVTPLDRQFDHYRSEYGRDYRTPSTWTRPKWAALTTQEQSIWKHVAEIAAGVLVEAMGAS